jgi:hypothetical protein
MEIRSQLSTASGKSDSSSIDSSFSTAHEIMLGFRPFLALKAMNVYQNSYSSAEKKTVNFYIYIQNITYQQST